MYQSFDTYVYILQNHFHFKMTKLWFLQLLKVKNDFLTDEFCREMYWKLIMRMFENTFRTYFQINSKSANLNQSQGWLNIDGNIKYSKQ